MTNILKTFTDRRITSIDQALLDLEKFNAEKEEQDGKEKKISKIDTTSTDINLSDFNNFNNSGEENIRPTVFSTYEHVFGNGMSKYCNVFTVEHIPYRKKMYTMRIQASYLDNGEEKTFLEWRNIAQEKFDKITLDPIIQKEYEKKYAEREQTKRNFRITSLPLQYALFKTMYERRAEQSIKKEIEELRMWIESLISKDPVLCFSNLRKDIGLFGMGGNNHEMRHDDDLDYAWYLNMNYVVHHNDEELKDYYHDTGNLFFGTPDIEEINKVFAWILNEGNLKIIMNTTAIYSRDAPIIMGGKKRGNYDVTFKIAQEEEKDNQKKWKSLAIHPILEEK